MSMRNPKIEFIGWDKSALELVGEKLLKLAENEPENFRRATIVVPTAESGRRLKEWLAEKAGKPLLMPRMKMVGQLIQAQGQEMASICRCAASGETPPGTRMLRRKPRATQRLLRGNPCLRRPGPVAAR